MKRTTISTLRTMKADNERISCLTAYDASFGRVLDEGGVDIILVGDSLGMVIQGFDTTLPVTVDDMIYHARSVAKVCRHSLLMVDMPFMSYTSIRQALATARRLMQEGGAHMIKLEGGAPQIETVKQLTHHGVPVCAHLGLQPQSVHKLGGYRVQGRDEAPAQQMLDDALALEAAGADALILECVPVNLAAEITQALQIPTIGIGAGGDCDGQVLVLHDILGLTPHPPKFAADFLQGQESIAAAVQGFVSAVKTHRFPADKHCFF